MKIVVHMIATLTIVGLISGGALSLINLWASPYIEANKIRDTEMAIYHVLPDGKKYETVKEGEFLYYIVYDENEHIVGYAVPSSGNGFQGKISAIAGVSKDFSEITKIEVLEQIETPGLGSKITEDSFKDQFNSLSTEPMIEYVKGIPPEKPNEIQAITGATITSKSLVNILNSGLEKLRKSPKAGSTK